MNIGTVFSGIGAPEQAFNGILGHNKVKVLFACDIGAFLFERKGPKRNF